MQITSQSFPVLPAEQSNAVQLVDHVETLALLRLVMRNQVEILAALRNVPPEAVAQQMERTFQECYTEAATNLNQKIQGVAAQADASGPTSPLPPVASA